jgi:hypothetical protein
MVNDIGGLRSGNIPAKSRFGLFSPEINERGSYAVPMPSFAQAALDETEWTKWKGVCDQT